MVRVAVHVTIAVAMTTLFLAPTGVADHWPDCEAVTAQELDVPFYAHPEEDRVEIWEETNQVPGLQPRGCSTKDGEHVERDLKIRELGEGSVDDAIRDAWTVEAFVCDAANNITPQGVRVLCVNDIVQL